MDGFPRDHRVGIGEQGREQRVESVRQLAQQAGRLHPVPLPFCDGFADHGGENLLCGLQDLSLAGSGQKCHDRRTDGEVGKVALVLHQLQRVNMRMVGQIKQSFGAHIQIGIS